MIDRLEQFRTECKEAVKECSRFCYATRAREFQDESLERLKSLLENAAHVKAEMVEAGAEDAANEILSLEETIKAFIGELRMWIALKDDDPHAAWTALIDAQSAARWAMQAHDAASHLESHLNRLHALEKLLFPRQVFMSAGLLVRRSTCSICGSEYGECNHVKGRAYMGQLCSRMIEQCDVLEASIVQNPASKHCRILTFTEGSETRDLMTWRIQPENAPAKILDFSDNNV